MLVAIARFKRPQAASKNHQFALICKRAYGAPGSQPTAQFPKIGDSLFVITFQQLEFFRGPSINFWVGNLHWSPAIPSLPSWDGERIPAKTNKWRSKGIFLLPSINGENCESRKHPRVANKMPFTVLDTMFRRLLISMWSNRFARTPKRWSLTESETTACESETKTYDEGELSLAHASLVSLAHALFVSLAHVSFGTDTS